MRVRCNQLEYEYLAAQPSASQQLIRIDEDVYELQFTCSSRLNWFTSYWFGRPLKSSPPRASASAKAVHRVDHQ